MSRSRRKRDTLWVISVGPHWQGEGRLGPGDRFIGHDGSPTSSRLRAATFHTYAEADGFASEKGIKLDGANRYIRQIDWES